MGKSSTKTAKASGSGETLRLSHVPGNWFVARSVAIPEDLDSRGLADFLELHVEEMSPFVLEQLYHGFYRADGGRRAFVYAALDQRLKSQVEGDTEADHILPDFGMGFGLKFPQASLIYFYHESVLSGVLYPADDPVPQMVVSLPVSGEELTEEALAPIREKIRKRMRRNLALGGTDPEAHPVRDADEVSVNERVFKLKASGDDLGNDEDRELVPLFDEEDAQAWPLPAMKTQTLWESDIRKPSSKMELRRTRLWNHRLWTAMLGLAACFLVLLLLEGGALVFSGLAKSETELAASRETEVSEIMAMAEMSLKISDVTRHQLLPFEMLDAINQVRPKDVYFTKMDTEGSLSLKFDGIGLRAESVGEFERLLGDLSFVESATISNQTVRQNRTSFKLEVKFIEGEIGPQTLPEATEESS